MKKINLEMVKKLVFLFAVTIAMILWLILVLIVQEPYNPPYLRSDMRTIKWWCFALYMLGAIILGSLSIEGENNTGKMIRNTVILSIVIAGGLVLMNNYLHFKEWSAYGMEVNYWQMIKNDIAYQYGLGVWRYLIPLTISAAVFTVFCFHNSIQEMWFQRQADSIVRAIEKAPIDHFVYVITGALGGEIKKKLCNSGKNVKVVECAENNKWLERTYNGNTTEIGIMCNRDIVLFNSAEAQLKSERKGKSFCDLLLNIAVFRDHVKRVVVCIDSDAFGLVDEEMREGCADVLEDNLREHEDTGVRIKRYSAPYYYPDH